MTEPTAASTEPYPFMAHAQGTTSRWPDEVISRIPRVNGKPIRKPRGARKRHGERHAQRQGKVESGPENRRQDQASGHGAGRDQDGRHHHGMRSDPTPASGHGAARAREDQQSEQDHGQGVGRLTQEENELLAQGNFDQQVGQPDGAEEETGPDANRRGHPAGCQPAGGNEQEQVARDQRAQEQQGERGVRGESAERVQHGVALQQMAEAVELEEERSIVGGRGYVVGLVGQETSDRLGPLPGCLTITRCTHREW